MVGGFPTDSIAALPIDADAYIIAVKDSVLPALIAQLKELQKTEPHIQDVRGRGLMIGIDLDIPHKDVRQPLIYQEHYFTGCAGTNILRLLPPLCLTKAEADLFIEKLKKTL